MNSIKVIQNKLLKKYLFFYCEKVENNNIFCYFPQFWRSFVISFFTDIFFKNIIVLRNSGNVWRVDGILKILTQFLKIGWNSELSHKLLEKYKILKIWKKS